jgi:hypothetical protein
LCSGSVKRYSWAWPRCFSRAISSRLLEKPELWNSVTSSHLMVWSWMNWASASFVLSFRL